MKHIPVRSCIVCRERKDKSDLLRIVGSPEDGFSLDVTGRAEGRGAYVCKNGKCMSELTKRRALDRAYKRKISSDVYEKLQKQFDEIMREDGKNG